MKKLKRPGILVILILCLTLLMAACTTGTPTSTIASSNEPTKVVSKEKTNIVFYGKIVEYSSGEPMTTALQNEFKDQYNIEAVQVDWGNLEKVIKTGIASGQPADIYCYWTGAMKTFVEANQALDLTPYLEANGGEWKKTFNQKLLDLGKFNNKYYNLPLDSNFTLVYANADIFAKAGVAIPDKWSWADFMIACKTIKEKAGVFPFTICSDATVQSWILRNGVLSIGKTENKIDALAEAQIPATDKMFSTVLKNIKDLYDKGYWYPGQGALTISRDESKAAFLQGKVSMLAEVSATAATIIKDAKFKVSVLRWPAMGAQNAVEGGCDGYFIPVNAPHKEDAVAILKMFLGEKIQTIHANAGFAVTNVNTPITDPIIKSLVVISEDVATKEFFDFSPKLRDYANTQITPDYILGKSESEVLNTLEKLRLEAIAK